MELLLEDDELTIARVREMLISQYRRLNKGEKRMKVKKKSWLREVRIN
jgi:hypothetical protein